MTALGAERARGAGRALGIGFVGAGFSATLHVEALKRVWGVPVRLAAVTAARPERAAEFARKHGVAAVHSTAAELLADPAVDVVCVCSPNSTHAELVIAAARAGKHVICEKPLTGAFGPARVGRDDRARDEWARARASADEIAAAVEGRVILCYAEDWVYAPAIAKVKSLLAASGGAILDLRAEESHSGSHAQRSRYRETAGGGALLMLGAHPIGAVLHLKAWESGRLGLPRAEVVSVTAETAVPHESAAAQRAGHDWIVKDWDRVETWANTVLTFSDGTTAVVTASFAMLGGIRNLVEVYATNGAYAARMTHSDSLMAYTPDPEAFAGEYVHEKLEARAGWAYASPDEDWARGYPQEMQDFVECIAAGRQPASDLALARDVVDVVYASYLSADEGRRVALAEGSRLTGGAS